MDKLIYGSIRANGIKIQYYRSGEDKQPVIMLHGLSDHGLCWNYLAMALQPAYDVILLDARGHGLSDKPETGYSANDHAADVAGFIQEMQLENPVVIGHSMGAVSAAVLASKNPRLIKCLILEDPAIGDNIGGGLIKDAHQYALTWRAQIEEYKGMSLEEIQQVCISRHPTWDPSDVFLWAKAKQLVSPNAANFIDEFQLSWRGVFKGILCPVLLVTADPHLGAIISADTAREAVQILPKGEVVHIHGAGHNIRRDQYRQFYSEVRPFLKKYGRRQ